jgi:hypothetical protein
MEYLLYVRKSTNPDHLGRTLWVNLQDPTPSADLDGITFRPSSVKVAGLKVTAQNEHYYAECEIVATKD